jgi:capsular polysaccharide biosynthesis protein
MHAWNGDSMEETSNFVNELGKYIEVMFRQWQLIVSVVLVCAITAAIVSFVIPKRYQAQALVATTKVTSSVSFGSSIQTLSDAQALAAGATSLAEKQARIQSYVQMVKSPTVAQMVLDELGSRLNSEDRDVSKLLDMVKGQVASNSDSIQISVIYQDPQLAADIANAWAKAYVDQVNAVYSEGGTLESYNAIKDQLAQAKTAYETAQSALENFTTQDQAANLQRMINENQVEINHLSIGYTDVISSVIGLQTQASTADFDQKIKDLTTQLQDKYAQRRLVGEYLSDAQDMYDQVQRGGDGAAASNTLALNLLKAQVFATSGGLGNIIVQSSPVPVSAQAMLSDLNSMIEVLKARQQTLDGEIQTLSSSISTPQGGTLDLTLGQQAQAAVQNFSNSVSYAQGDNSNTPRENRIFKLEDATNQLNAQLLKAQSQKNELTRARDLAWDTYKNLATKTTELEVTTKTENSTVALASPAAVPEKKLTSTTKNVLLALVASLILGICATYAIEFWWAYKGVEPRRIGILSRRRDG